MNLIRVSDFSTVPGPRHRNEGEHSGEQFREERLIPAFRKARHANQTLRVEFDGVRFGYPTSFLEEAFGGLARQVGVHEALDGLELYTIDYPLLVEEIRRYIKNANKTSRERAAG